MLYLAVNRNWGSFHVPAEVAIAIGCDRYDNSDEVRCDPVLIDWIRNHPDENLKVARIPDWTTDFRVLDYDGMESVICCVDGKLVYAKVE